MYAYDHGVTDGPGILIVADALARDEVEVKGRIDQFGSFCFNRVVKHGFPFAVANAPFFLASIGTALEKWLSRSVS